MAGFGGWLGLFGGRMGGGALAFIRCFTLLICLNDGLRRLLHSEREGRAPRALCSLSTIHYQLSINNFPLSVINFIGMPCPALVLLALCLWLGLVVGWAYLVEGWAVARWRSFAASLCLFA